MTAICLLSVGHLKITAIIKNSMVHVRSHTAMSLIAAAASFQSIKGQVSPIIQFMTKVTFTLATAPLSPKSSAVLLTCPKNLINVALAPATQHVTVLFLEGKRTLPTVELNILNFFKGTVWPDWICMRVVSLENPLKGHQPLHVLNFLFLILNI